MILKSPAGARRNSGHNSGFIDAAGQWGALHIKSMRWTFPSFQRRGGAPAPGWLLTSRSHHINAAKQPLFNKVRCATIYKVASRLHKPPRSLRELPLLEKEGNVHLKHFLCKAAMGSHYLSISTMNKRCIRQLR